MKLSVIQISYLQKCPDKGRAVDNYRPMSYLPLMWKLLMRMIVKEMYGFLKKEKILPDEISS